MLLVRNPTFEGVRSGNSWNIVSFSLSLMEILFTLFC